MKHNIKTLLTMSVAILSILFVVMLMVDAIVRFSEYSYKDIKTESFTFSLKRQKGICFLRGCYVVYKCESYYDTCPSGDSEFVLRNMPKITDISYENNTLKVYLAKKFNLSGKFYLSELNNNKPITIIDEEIGCYDYGYVKFIKAKLNIVWSNTHFK